MSANASHGERVRVSHGIVWIVSAIVMLGTAVMMTPQANALTAVAPQACIDAGTPVIGRKNTSGCVKLLQRALNRQNSSPKLVVDGIFGVNTEKAVKAFQRSHHLSADGVVGKYTWDALKKADLITVALPEVATAKKKATTKKANTSNTLKCKAWQIKTYGTGGQFYCATNSSYKSYRVCTYKYDVKAYVAAKVKHAPPAVKCGKKLWTKNMGVANVWRESRTDLDREYAADMQSYQTYLRRTYPQRMSAQ